MSADLRRLAFNQGSKEDLDTEDKMMERIRGLAVSVLHAAVHTVALHESSQSPGESTKAFAARVRGTATTLSKLARVPRKSPSWMRPCTTSCLQACMTGRAAPVTEQSPTRTPCRE